MWMSTVKTRLLLLYYYYKYGVTATGWKLDSLLRSLYYMFSDSPARREYESLTASSTWPLSFCGTRWLEDVPVAERALLVWPHIEKYVTTTLSGPKSKIPVIRSFQNLKEHVLDPLSTAKLQFFITKSSYTFPKEISVRTAYASIHGRRIVHNFVDIFKEVRQEVCP